MKIITIIQARMSSNRLPGKVLMEIDNKTILGYVIDSALKSTVSSEVVVATSLDESDDPIEIFCSKNNYNCFRGSLNNVLDRYLNAARKYEADIVIRLTADCPLVSYFTIDEVTNHLIINSLDYASNTTPPETSIYPDGSDVEVFTMKALIRAHESEDINKNNEHVTFQFWKSSFYKIDQIKNLKKNYSSYRYTLDYHEDFTVISFLINKLKLLNNLNYKIEDIITLLDNFKEIRDLNKKYFFGIGWKNN